MKKEVLLFVGILILTVILTALVPPAMNWLTSLGQPRPMEIITFKMNRDTEFAFGSPRRSLENRCFDGPGGCTVGSYYTGPISDDAKRIVIIGD